MDLQKEEEMKKIEAFKDRREGVQKTVKRLVSFISGDGKGLLQIFLSPNKTGSSLLPVKPDERTAIVK